MNFNAISQIFYARGNGLHWNFIINTIMQMKWKYFVASAKCIHIYFRNNIPFDYMGGKYFSRFDVNRFEMKIEGTNLCSSVPRSVLLLINCWNQKTVTIILSVKGPKQTLTETSVSIIVHSNLKHNRMSQYQIKGRNRW